MRYSMKYVFGVAAILAVASTGHPVLASELGRESFIILAQAPQPAPTTPAPTAGAQEQPSDMSTMPGHMEHGKGMGEMGNGKMGKGMGSSTTGQGHPGPMGGTPQCPTGQTASGTPQTCK